MLYYKEGVPDNRKKSGHVILVLVFYNYYKIFRCSFYILTAYKHYPIGTESD